MYVVFVFVFDGGYLRGLRVLMGVKDPGENNA